MSSSSSYARRPRQSEQYPAQLTASTFQAALFASFLSTFLIETLSLLQPDPLDAIQDILLYQTLVMQNSTSGPYVASVFSPPPYAVAVNALFFASLGVVLIAAFLCMLVKGWIRELDRKLRGIPDLQKRAVIKELREQGLVRWRLPDVITILPSLIHLSLVLFFIGLALYLLQIHKLPAFVAISIFGLGVLLYVLSIFVSAIDDFSPFRSPYSRPLGVLYRRLYSRLLSPFVYGRLSSMALPQTIAEKIREQMSIFIKAHEPLSELAILDPQSPSSKQLISQTSAPVLNKLWSSVDSEDTSAYAKNICTSILLQLDDLDIRPPRSWHFPWPYETSSPSIKEAQCLVYDTCMQMHVSRSWRYWKTIRTSVGLLEQRPDPWFRLVTLLVRSRVNIDDWDMLKSNIKSDGSLDSRWLLGVRDVALWKKAELLEAISDIESFSAGQWNFVLSAMIARVNDLDTGGGHALAEILAEILVRLLQKRVDLFQRPPMRGEELNFWLFVMRELLDGGLLVRRSIIFQPGEIEHMRDIGAYGEGNLRNPDNIRQLIQLSRVRGLDPSLMGGCPVTILCILILPILKNRHDPSNQHSPMNQQELGLVNQYLDILGEMDVTVWSVALTEVPIMSWTPFYLTEVVSCLLSGAFPSPDHWGPSHILHEFDHKLTAVGAQPTTSILKVIDKVFSRASPATEPDLQNAWLSLYNHNQTGSSISTIPLAWSPDCTSIASKRLDLYDSEKLTPEMDLIIFFLSSHSVSITCRALRWYLRLKENVIIYGDTLYFVSFPVIFQKGLSMDENRESWLLLVDLIARNWKGAPSEWRSHFIEIFFGYENSQANNQSTTHETAQSTGVENEKGQPHIQAQASAAQSDGLGWMEDVWMTVSRPCITPTEPQWIDFSGIMHAAYPQSTEPDDKTSPPESGAHAAPDLVSDAVPHKALAEAPQGALPESIEKRLEDPGRGLLEVLANFLEAGTTSMPRTLCDRLRNSCLLKDERMSHDADSLRRIDAVLNRNEEGLWSSCESHTEYLGCEG